VYTRFSYPLDERHIVMPGAIDPPELIPRSRMSAPPADTPPSAVRWGSYNNTSFARFFVHTGTHLDVNFHIDTDGARLEAFAVEDFIAERPCLLEITKQAREEITAEELQQYEAALAQADFLFVFTGFSACRATDPKHYASEQPGFSVGAARYLMDRFRLKGVGVDLLGIENIANAKSLDPPFPVHRAFLTAGRPFYLVEDADLKPLVGKAIRRAFMIPLLLPGAEAMPITGFADLEG